MPETTNEPPLFSEDHTCTCSNFHWQEKTTCKVHPDQDQKPVVSSSKVMHIAEDGICESCE